MNDCAFVREISFFVHDDFEAAGDPSVFVKLVLEVVVHGFFNVVRCLFDVFYVPSAATVSDLQGHLRRIVRLSVIVINGHCQNGGRPFLEIEAFGSYTEQSHRN